MDTLKTIGISAVVVIVALLLTGNFGGPAIGGTYEITKQYFSAGVEVAGGVTSDDLTSSDDIVVGDDLTVTDDATFGTGNVTSTTSINFGKACWTIKTVNGSTTYAFFNSVGNIATSSASCN